MRIRLMEVALEAGAEDFKAEEQGYEILDRAGEFRSGAQTDRSQRHQTGQSRKSIRCRASPCR